MKIYNRFLFVCVSLLCLSGLFQSCDVADSVDLSGEWHYRLDKEEKGLEQLWYATSFDEAIDLPAALRDYGIGDIPSLSTDWTGSIYDSSWYFDPNLEKYRRDDIKFPFWLTPVTHYKGMAWFQRTIDIPKSWKGKPVNVSFERPHWQTKVWIDTLCIGEGNSLSVPHRFSFSTADVSVGSHQLTVRVDNAIREIDPGINSHSISDHTQGNWNGIVGKMTMQLVPNNPIDKVKITPLVKEKAVLVELSFHNPKASLPNSVKIAIKGVNHKHIIPEQEFDVNFQGGVALLKVPMGDDMKSWSEFSPDFYQMKVSAMLNGEISTSKIEYFGMRQFTMKGGHFAINEIPVFLRGTTECCVFPLTGYPPTDVAQWDSIFAVCKAFGLNHMRFHSYCPPEAAFFAADKAGFYLQVEGPSWAKYSTSLGYGKPIDQYLMDETKRILDEYANHPSFVMMAYGNEPSGRYVGYLENWVAHFRTYDSRVLYSGASTGRSWSIIENSDFIVRSPPRGLKWKSERPTTLFDYRNNTEGQQRPYVTFEMGQWCVFPDFKEIDKYTGSLKAKNFELFSEDLADKGMANMAEDFLMASGKLQASCYKQEIEATLRTPNLAGFQLLSLNDFSGQGTALVGVLNAFWQEKGYVTADEFSQFCNKVVPLVRLPKFVFHANETLIAPVEVANFSGADFQETIISWSLKDDKQQLVGGGEWEVERIGLGHHELGQIKLSLSPVTTAAQLILEVRVGDYSNKWSIWVYPSEKESHSSSLYICERLDNQAKLRLESGGKVLCLAHSTIKNGKDIVHYQTPVFWNTSWFRMRPPHTTGLLIDDKHALFANFPTNYYTDHQWWELANRANVMDLSHFPDGFKPIVQPIDTWFMNRKLGMLFEAQVAGGKLLMISMDVMSQLKDRPVALRLHNAIIEYMNSSEFNPQQKVEIEQLKVLFEESKNLTFNPGVKEQP